MQVKVDYLSFNAPTRIPMGQGDLDLLSIVDLVMEEYLEGLWSPITIGHSWETYKAKGFYHTRFFDADAKISVFCGNVNRHVYCEIGGQALDFIRALGCYEDLIQKVATRTSRVDFAVDLETETRPSDFIVNRQVKAFKAGGEVFSEDGETAYVGSWKAERFARVYRYHEPHPRAKLLRVECVLRGNYAKQGMSLILNEGEVAAAMVAHKAFGWSHPDWEPDVASESSIKSQRADKERAGTVRWIYGDVIRAIAKAHAENLIDVNNFIAILRERTQFKDGP
jgi:hypothetical protein